MERLLQNGLLTPEAIDKADESTIKELIYPVYYPLFILLHVVEGVIDSQMTHAAIFFHEKYIRNELERNEIL